MAIIFTSGTITTSTSEDTIFDITEDRFFSTWIYLHNMTSTETFRIKIYIKDENASTLRVYLTFDVSGVQADPAYHIAFLPATEYKVTIQKTAGTNRAVTWLRAEVA